MDPHAVLGLGRDASAEDVQRAYRALAKRFHPDRAGTGSEALMASINAAYDLLRDQLADDHTAATGGRRAPAEPGPGAWLPGDVRRVLAPELLGALEPDEAVDEIVLTATGDSHDVQLAVTDRRLLWLRDDAIMGRVRSLRLHEVRGVEARPGGRLRRLGHLRVTAADGTRMRFFELHPGVLGRLAAAIERRTAA